MDMSTIISKMLVLVILMSLGYFLGRVKVLNEKRTAVISKIVLYVATPANMIVCLLDEGLNISGKDAVVFFAITVGCYVFYYLLALIVPKVIKSPYEDVGLYRHMTMFLNCGYMGYPVAQAIFGMESTLYVSYFVILFNILSFSLGIKMMSHGKSEFKLKMLINPVIIGTVVSLVMMLLKVRLPEVVMGTIEGVTQIITPMAMIVIGSTLSSTPVKSVFNEWRIIPMVFVRLIISPLVVWAVLRNFITDPLMLGVATVISGMPVGSVSTMMSIEYGQNAALASKVTFATSVVSAVTIPLIVYVLL